VLREVDPVATTLRPDGSSIVDFGENIAGVCRVRLRGPAGAVVQLRHAEALEPDGSLYRENLRIAMGPTESQLPLEGARQEDTFVLAGTGDWEVFEPRFTYHGFRYVEVDGLRNGIELGEIAALVIGSELRRTGDFDCSEPLFRQIVENTVRTQQSNSVGIPTDCPQRDERLGWAGDAQLFCGTAVLLHDVAAFYSKWLADMRDAQHEDGRFADIAPNPFAPPISPPRFYGNPAWADAGVLVPWRLYRTYGDAGIIEESFESMRRWIDWIVTENPDLLFTEGKPPLEYGDWLNGDTLDVLGWPRAGGEMPKVAFATAWFAHSTQTFARIATVLGRDREAREYGALAARITARFVEAFVGERALIAGDTQAGYALALHFGLLPREYETAAAARLLDSLSERQGRLSTGIQSTLPMLLELSERGAHRTSVDLVRRRDIPSWGYMLEGGATTIWERWDAYVPGRGFQEPIMNSLNHVAFGAVVQWMFEAVAGIRVDEQNGETPLSIVPQVGCGLSWASAGIETMHGRVRSAWRLSDGAIQLDVIVPANTRARVVVPSSDPARASAAPTRPPVELTPEAAIFEVGSGEYRFHAPVLSA
jgi:alpha-L-rhamnosidase